jgi:ABC-type bacteriocin/lantibiotic exporter with double-glycine peptidase domain
LDTVATGSSSGTGQTSIREFYAFVWRSSASQQFVLILLGAAAALMAMVPLELQRHIVNTLAGREKIENLVWLCGAYLIGALGISGLKYVLNIKSASLGEAMILSLREAISGGRSPVSADQQSSSTTKANAGTFVAMISAEAEAVGKFVGDCISTPIIQIGTLLSVLGYMVYTEPLLGLVVLLIAIPQVVIVPISQRRINVHVKERVGTLRHAGDLMVDALQGGGAAHVVAGGSEIAKAFAAIYRVRLRVFRIKFAVKFLIGALQSIGIFALLLVGGIMVLKGRTEIGIVVAFISGLDRVIDPCREAIAFIRSTSAAKVQFDMMEDTLGRKL